MPKKQFHIITGISLAFVFYASTSLALPKTTAAKKTSVNPITTKSSSPKSIPKKTAKQLPKIKVAQNTFVRGFPLRELETFVADLTDGVRNNEFRFQIGRDHFGESLDTGQIVDLGLDMVGVIFENGAVTGILIDMDRVISTDVTGVADMPFTANELFNMAVVDGWSQQGRTGVIPDGGTGEGTTYVTVYTNSETDESLVVNHQNRNPTNSSAGDTFHHSANSGSESSGRETVYNGESNVDYNDSDVDNDGTQNWQDNDIDGDGQINGEDIDDDNDGIPDGADPDPDNQYQGEATAPPDVDNDGDGTSNRDDTDIDGDGTTNSEDDDTDGDGIPNDQDEDDDGDGTEDSADSSPQGKFCPACDDRRRERRRNGKIVEDLVNDFLDQISHSVSESFMDRMNYLDTLVGDYETVNNLNIGARSILLFAPGQLPGFNPQNATIQLNQLLSP